MFGVDGEIDIRFDSPEGFAEVAVAWLDAGIASLAAAESAEILAGPPLTWGESLDDGQSRLGPGGSAWGNIVLVGPPLRTPRNLLYSAASLAKVRTAAPGMSSVWLVLERLNDEGFHQMPVCSLLAEREGESSGVARLMIGLGYEDPQLAAGHPGVVFMRAFAERHAADFGHISYNSGGAGGETALEDALGRYPEQTVYEMDTYLRGYSWLTIVPRVLAERLGGVTGLRGTGVFHEVAELAGGAVWLLATPRWVDYRGEIIDAVFDVLAPVLPAGVPRPYKVPDPSQPPLLVSWRDAKDHH